MTKAGTAAEELEEVKEQGTAVLVQRPRTRRFLQQEEQRRKDEEAKQNEPRRSDRNHNSIRLTGAAAFYRRLQTLFFAPASHKTWKAIGNPRQPMRRIFRKPHIYEIHNFLKEPELEFFDSFIESCPFQRSFVDNMEYKDMAASSKDTENESTTQPPSKRQRRTLLDSTHRTSTFYGFRHRANSTIRAIEQRTADLLGCWVHQIEGLQLVRYLPGQFFGVHHDLGDLLDNDEVLLPPKNPVVKRRLVTIFVYLNDLDPGHGGCTLFPKCSNLRVQPKRGKAVLWSNIHSDGSPDARTIHAGESVKATKATKGVVKYGLNIWITEE